MFTSFEACHASTLSSYSQYVQYVGYIQKLLSALNKLTGSPAQHGPLSVMSSVGLVFPSYKQVYDMERSKLYNWP